jgi:hypothetical protein
LQYRLTLCTQSGPLEYTGVTDASGFFTVTTGLPDGSYDWRIVGPRYLVKAGTLALSGDTSSVEMGLQIVGDANNDNVINVQDFNILKTTFGKQTGDPGYDDRADFTGDLAVTITDFNLLKSNFGQAGAAASCP